MGKVYSVYDLVTYLSFLCFGTCNNTPEVSFQDQEQGRRYLCLTEFLCHIVLACTVPLLGWGENKEANIIARRTKDSLTSHAHRTP